MALTLSGNLAITGAVTAISSGPTPPTPPIPITAVAGNITTILGYQNTAITSFNSFSSVSNGVTPYTYYVSQGVLPTGISINGNTGQVSGTPTSTYASNNVTFSVVDAYSTLATTNLTVNFTVNAALVATAGANTAVQAYQNTAITSFNPFSSVTGGYTPYTYYVSTGSLPSGITVNSSTGLVSGTPTTTYAAANVIFSVKDVNNVIASTTNTINFTVVANITATAGGTSSVTVQQNSAIASFNPFSSVTGGYTPYTYYVVSGTLPTGISLDPSTGLVSGTPTVVQSAASVVFGVQDANSKVAATTKSVSFTVTAPPTPYTVNYLVVAGGGGGGASSPGPTTASGGGGGGGGGVVTSSYPQAPGTLLSITVGGGGSAGTPTGGVGLSGSPSTLTGATTAIGGGGGGGWLSGLNPPFTPVVASSGGSGGGGTNSVSPNFPTNAGLVPGAGGSGPQGHAGGSSGGQTTPPVSLGGGGGGGGGAGTAGGNGTKGGAPWVPTFPSFTGIGGPGGQGITWGFTGPTTYSSGGGGGGGVGAGSGTTPSSSYGGGGYGGAMPTGNQGFGGPGQAGVVILAVPSPNYSGIKTGGTASVNPPAAPGMTVITYTGPGSYTV